MDSDDITERCSIFCQNVYKTYDFKSRGKWILKDLNLALPYGKVLLGESGSGKTTLIKCIIGKIAIDKGNLRVMGKKPKAGPLIGYMPQSTSLSEKLTVKETLWLYGRVMGLSQSKTRKQKSILLNLLSMTQHDDSLIATLSEGEKRRVSFAVALLNEAPLILLDEPTVGVDPALRHIIWQYLKSIVRNLNLTVILTTHYIDEAKHSDNVGFLHNGHVIANSPPDDLLIRYDCTTLEQVFLQVCQSNIEHSENSKIFTKTTLSQYLVPIAILMLIPLSFDDVPHEMPLAIVNHDSGALGQAFANQIDPSLFQTVSYNNSETAIKASKLGHTTGVVIISKDFSTSLKKFGSKSLMVSNNSLIQVHFNEMNTIVKQASIFLSFQKFTNQFQNQNSIANLPIEFTNSMSQRPQYKTTSYTTPGLILCLCLTLYSSISGIALYEMIQNGQLERLNTAGISSSEIAISMALFQTISITPFLAIVFIVTFVINGTSCQGSYSLVLFLLFLQANCGIYLGLFMSSISVNAIMVILLNDALFLITVMIQDVTLPLALMTDGLKLFSEKGPSATTVASLRGIFNYGWSLSQPTVTQAVITNFSWIFASFILSLVIFQIKQ